MIVAPGSLPTQVDHRGTGPPSPTRFMPARGHKPGWPNKPDHGSGLWTSSLGASGCWLDYCREAAPAWLQGASGAWTLEPLTTARVWELDSLGDLLELARLHGPR